MDIPIGKYIIRYDKNVGHYINKTTDGHASIFTRITNPPTILEITSTTYGELLLKAEEAYETGVWPEQK